MVQFIMQDLTQEERINLLRESKKAEAITYSRHLTDAEIDNESKKLANEVKSLAAIEDEKKEANREFKERIDAVRERMDVISKILLEGNKFVTERCFKVLNVEGREVGYYNASGELVKVRAMLDDDLQMDLFENEIPGVPAGALPQAAPAGENQDVEDVEFEDVNEDPDDEGIPRCNE